MERKRTFEIMSAIMTRAEVLGLVGSRIKFALDMDVADTQFNMRWDDLLGADMADFIHDVVGIQNNVDRQNKVMAEGFMPRFARNEKEAE